MKVICVLESQCTTIVTQVFAYNAHSMGASFLGTFGICGWSCHWTTRATLAPYRCTNSISPNFSVLFFRSGQGDVLFAEYGFDLTIGCPLRSSNTSLFGSLIVSKSYNFDLNVHISFRHVVFT